MKTRSVRHLLAEHQQLGQILDAFERYLTQTEQRCHQHNAAGAVLDPHELWAIFDYLSEHLLMRHEEKEEVYLLPELSRHGLSWSDTDLQHVRQEHRHARYLMRSLRQAVHQSREWSRDDCRHFLSVGKELVSFLRHHMSVEEKELFRRLDGELDDATDQQLASDFEGVDEDFSKMPDAQDLLLSSQQFVQRYCD